jgi:hypothetical protein
MNFRACIKDLLDGYDGSNQKDRRDYLLSIKKASPTLHALTLQALDERRKHIQVKRADFSKHWDEATGPMKKVAELLPSPYRLKLEISDQLFEYSREDLRKIAADIKAGHAGAKEAFHFVYSNIFG